MKRISVLLICLIAILLSGCIWFDSIEQPTSISPVEIFTVSITVYAETGPAYPYFGVCLPDGWTILGDSLRCTGLYTEPIYYDSLVSAEQDSASPAPDGYYWWAGSGAGVGPASGYVLGEFEVQTNYQTGFYSIDYMLGNSYNGVNQERSNHHIVWSVGNYSPRGLQATVENSSIILTWEPPLITAGLLGYNIYCDQQMLNTGLLLDTTFIDEDLHDGIQYYSVSSFYDDSTEHLTPGELPVLYGDLYVTPEGSNLNNGSSFTNALQTITYAIYLTTQDTFHPHVIFLGPGIFSPNTNGEQFPITCVDRIHLIGSGESVTVLDANHQDNYSILEFDDVSDCSINGMTICNSLIRGIHCQESTVQIEDVTITGNCTSENEDGGGIWCYESEMVLKNVTISDNSAYSGAGIYFDVSWVYLENVTISGNNATWSGAGISGWGEYCSLENSILWENSAIEWPQIYMYGDADVSYSNIQGGWPGIGNIDEDPQFVDPENWDFSLQRISPCIDTGDPASNPDPDSTRSDMGALYFHQDMSIKLTLTPENQPIIIPDGGGRFNFNIELTNRTDETQSFDLWTEIELPGWGSVEILNTTGLAIAIGDTIDRNRTQEVPGFAPAGEYTYFAYVGTYPWIVDDYYYFYFEKDGTDQSGPLGETSDWLCWGQEFYSEITLSDDELPSEFKLHDAYPNPFNPVTTISYDLPKGDNVSLIIYDVMGREIAKLVDSYKVAGTYNVTFNAKDLVSGVYFVKLEAGDFKQTQKLLLVK